MPKNRISFSDYIKNQKGTVLTVVLSTALCIVLHQFAPDPRKENIPLSDCFENGLFMPLIAIGLLVTFSLLAVVFRFIAARTEGPSLELGIRFGLSFSLIWLMGFLEGSLYYGTSLKHDILHGLSDAIPMMIMFPVIGALLKKKSSKKAERPAFAASIVIGMFYFFGRYFLYIILGIDSTVHERPWEMFAWTASVGISIGSLFYLASESLSAFSPLKTALVFSVFIFGIDWLLFYSFAPIIQKTSLLDNFIRPAIDILFVGLGAFTCSRLARSGDQGPARVSSLRTSLPRPS